MKKIYGFAALCAAMTLASCSNDNEPKVVDNGPMEPVYMRIAISGATNGTRNSMNDNNATPAETNVSSASFVLFDESGNAIGTATANDLTFGCNDETPEGITESATKSIKFEKQPGTLPGYIVCVLNKDVTGDVTSTTTIGSLHTTVLDSYKNGDDFIMSNAARVNALDNNENYATKVVAYTDKSADKDNIAVTPIYVERVAARIDYTAAEGFAADAKKVGVNDGEGKTVDVTVEIKSINLYNGVTNANLIKDLGSLTAETAINDNDGLRSHWGVNVASRSYNDLYSLTNFTNGVSLGVGNNVNIGYVCENFGTGATDANLTKVIIKGELKVAGKNLAENPIYKLSDNTYYTTEGMQNYILNKLQRDGYRKVVNNEIKDLDATNIDFTDGAKSYDCYAQIKLNTGEALKYLNNNNASVSDANEALKADKNYRAYQYTDGLCYYYVPIQADGKGYGVVRNHIYNIKINKIAGLGIPMFKPTNDLIPEDPEKLTPEGDKPDWYVNCNINVLNWTLYTQNADFGTPGDQ